MSQEIKLIGFKYTKIILEKNEEEKGELKITPNINIQSIEEFKSEIKKEIGQEIIQVNFQFNIDYSFLGKVEISGKMFLLTDSKTFKNILSGWKNKKMDDNINLIIINIIMQKASLQALKLEEEVGLPPHIQLPRLQLNKKE